MEITNELLAAYAEGNVSKQEREVVRQYLTERPEELESVMMMMDDFYDLDIINDKKESDTKNQIINKQSCYNACYSSAAFAPGTLPMNHNLKTPRGEFKERFSDRLDNFLDELGI